MKIDYVNMPNGASKLNFALRYLFNILRTWFLFTFRYPWIKYNGFVRVMSHTTFAKIQISIGHHVQFGHYCNIASNVKFGSYILMAGRVCFVGRNDHEFSVPGQYIWHGARGNDGITIVEDDVWIGHGSTIIAGVTIGRGSIIAAGSVINRDVPPCEIWAGVPARKIRDRFPTSLDKERHLQFLRQSMS